jgi:hypothetical protein
MSPAFRFLSCLYPFLPSFTKLRFFVAESVSLLGKRHTAPFARKWPVVNMHAGMFHDIAAFCELCRTDRAPEDLIHASGPVVDSVGLLECIASVLFLKLLVSVRFLGHRLLEIRPYRWV